MPLMKSEESQAGRQVAREFRRIAAAVEKLARAQGSAQQRARARSHAELQQVAVELGRAADTLEKAAGAGSLTAQQQRTIGRNFARVAQALEEAAETSR